MPSILARVRCLRSCARAMAALNEGISLDARLRKRLGNQVALHELAPLLGELANPDDHASRLDMRLSGNSCKNISASDHLKECVTINAASQACGKAKGRVRSGRYSTALARWLSTRRLQHR